MDKLGVAIGTPIAQYLAQNHSYKEGFYFCAAAGFVSLLATVLLFYFVMEKEEFYQHEEQNTVGSQGVTRILNLK